MILLTYGTRPEWIKIKPLIDYINEKIPYEILFTGQHENIAHGFFNHSLKITHKNNRLDSIISSILNNIDFEKYKGVLVQGDTATAFAVALSSFNNQCKIFHLEAGLRTYDLKNPYPEEAYRQMISRISDIHFCPTENSKQNLHKEQIKNNIYVVGNTVLDNLKNIKTSYGQEILVTLHRRENHEIIDDWMQQIDKLNKKITLIKHPNPNVINAINKLKNVNVIDPLPHNKMIEKIANCKFLITDSGGLQEEGSFLNKKIIICRKTTERPEVLEHHGILCDSPKNLKKLVEIIDKDYIINKPCPFGDGKASEKIYNILKELK